MIEELHKCSRGHEYPESRRISLGCPDCLGEWLEMGLTMD